MEEDDVKMLHDSNILDFVDLTDVLIEDFNEDTFKLYVEVNDGIFRKRRLDINLNNPKFIYEKYIRELWEKGKEKFYEDTEYFLSEFLNKAYCNGKIQKDKLIIKCVNDILEIIFQYDDDPDWKEIHFAPNFQITNKMMKEHYDDRDLRYVDIHIENKENNLAIDDIITNRKMIISIHIINHFGGKGITCIEDLINKINWREVKALSLNEIYELVNRVEQHTTSDGEETYYVGKCDEKNYLSIFKYKCDYLKNTFP